MIQCILCVGRERDDLAPAHGRHHELRPAVAARGVGADVRGGKILQGAYDNPPGGCGHGLSLCILYWTSDSGPVAAIYGK